MVGRYKYKRKYDWSSNIAYSVGLIASDGSLSKDGRHIDLTSTDLEILTNFIAAIGRKLEIKLKNRGEVRWKPSFRVQFSDVAYYDFLVSAGLSAGKSRTLRAVNVPDIFYPDFLRGVFDGDGTVYGYSDTRWANSFMFYASIASASYEFLSFTQRKNNELIGISGANIRKGSDVYQLSYAKRESELLYGAIYKKSDGLHLGRKKRKLEDFMSR